MRAADSYKSAIIFAILPIHFQISFPAVMTENQIEVRLDSEHFFPLFFDAVILRIQLSLLRIQFAPLLVQLFYRRNFLTFQCAKRFLRSVMLLDFFSMFSGKILLAAGGKTVPGGRPD
jgi:hypothetical protein